MLKNSMITNINSLYSLLDKDIQQCADQISPQKLQKMIEVVNTRTRHVTVVTQELHYAYNASAVMRTAECFGIQDMHAIQQYNTFSPYTGISRGSYKWTSLYHYNTTNSCYAHLKKEGYRIIVTSPHAGAKKPEEIPVDQRIALVFGNENLGVSSYAQEHADDFITIPMAGFTESLNVSTCASVCLYEITRILRNSSVSWQLTKDEQCKLITDWIKLTLLD